MSLCLHQKSKVGLGSAKWLIGDEEKNISKNRKRVLFAMLLNPLMHDVPKWSDKL